MANDFYDESGIPSTGAALNSATVRGEFTSIGAAFDLMPGLTGNGNKVVTINAGGTALSATAATALSGMVIGTNLQAWDVNLDQIAALAVTDGNIIVGNGSAWVAESGATARTSLGLAIGTDVQAWDADLDALAALASTAGMVARTGAGAFAVRTLTGTAAEIDVANGTGASAAPTFSLPAALTFTGKTVTGGTFSSPTLTAPALNGALSGDAIAAQAEMETGSATDSIVTPGRQHFHPGHPKGWAQVDTLGGATAYNVNSIADNGVGDLTVSWETDFSSTSYCAVVTPQFDQAGSAASTLVGIAANSSFAGGTTRCIVARVSDGAFTDPNYTHIAVFGDRA